MNLTNEHIYDGFDDTMLIDYLSNVIGNNSLVDVINKMSQKITIFKNNGKTDIIEAIDKHKIEYIILATKLTTMIEIFKKIQSDENIVMSSEIEKELNRFQDVISQGILMTNKELINK